MQRPKIDDELTLIADFGETRAICAEVSDDSAHPGGLLLKVMSRGPFEEGQQYWIVGPPRSKSCCRRENEERRRPCARANLS